MVLSVSSSSSSSSIRTYREPREHCPHYMHVLAFHRITVTLTDLNNSHCPSKPTYSAEIQCFVWANKRHHPVVGLLFQGSRFVVRDILILRISPWVGSACQWFFFFFTAGMSAAVASIIISTLTLRLSLHGTGLSYQVSQLNREYQLSFHIIFNSYMAAQRVGRQ